MKRTIGRTALVLGGAAFVAALLGLGPSIARLWSQLHANSLVGLQGFVDRTLDPDPGNPTVWFDQVLPILASSVFYGVAVVLVAIGLGILLTSRS